MALSMQEKQHVGREVALRYLRARKKEKGIMLQEFCATTGSSPPYAAYLLRTSAKRVILGGVTLVPTRPSPWRRQRKHVYGPALVEALVWMSTLPGSSAGGDCRQHFRSSYVPWREAGPWSRILSLLPFSRWGLQGGPATTGGEGKRGQPEALLPDKTR